MPLPLTAVFPQAGVNANHWSLPLADLHRMLFEDGPGAGDREVLVTARLMARVKEFLSADLTEAVVSDIRRAIITEFNRLVSDGLLDRHPDWLAVIHRGRLNVAFGAGAVQELSRQLRREGAF